MALNDYLRNIRGERILIVEDRMAPKKTTSRKLTAGQTAQKLTKIAMKVLAPMSEEEQEARISAAEKRVATKNFICFR
jgi:hypothetical protein